MFHSLSTRKRGYETSNIDGHILPLHMRENREQSKNNLNFRLLGLVCALTFLIIIFFQLQTRSFNNEKSEKFQPNVIQVSDDFFETEETEEESPKDDGLFLIIAIGTIPRKGNVDYLENSLNSLREELTSYKSPKSIMVYIQSFVKNHTHFNRLRNMLEYSQNFTFIDSVPRFLDPYTDKPGHDYTHPANVIPGKRARQQTCDIISMMENVIKTFQFKYFMFMEDDFLACENSINNIVRSLEEIEKKKKKLCSFVVSYGMSGIVMEKDTLKSFIEFSKLHIQELPIDVLAFQFMGGRAKVSSKYKTCLQESKTIYTYKTVQLEHIGDISTFPERNSKGFRPSFPKCNTPMVRGKVWNVAGYFNRRCKEFSPCD